MALSCIPIKLSSNDKDKLQNLIEEINKIQWETNEYYFRNFVDYYQLPQIIRIERTGETDFNKNQLMYLTRIFDRYLIIASLLTTKNHNPSNEKYLIPDWFQGECRILSKNPTLKKRWWIFQGAFELYRFELPRSIKILSYTPAHIKTTNSEWNKVMLCRNASFIVIRRQQYQLRIKNTKDELFISEEKEAFVLQDPKTNNEFLIPPGVPIRFATLIKDHELHKQYQHHDGIFTFPEILLRYEFPIDVEIRTHLPVDLPDFKTQIRLEKFCVAKSILAYLIDNEQPKMVEFSPLTQFTIHCAKCLTFGLSQENDKSKDEKFDEKEYQSYENIRSKMNSIFHDTSEIYRSKIQSSTPEEIESIEKAYEISMKIKTDDDKPIEKAYLPLDEAFKIIKQKGKNEIPFPKIQPKRFTVLASADPSNPYNEIIDYENMDKSSSKKEDNLTKNLSDNKSQQMNQRPALVVQQLPPPTLLSPESFEKTVKAIPEKLYTEILPATKPKKPNKTKPSEPSTQQQTV